MYQVIDERDDEELAPPPRFPVLPFLIGAILAGFVFFVVWLLSPGEKISTGYAEETPASRSAYLAALAEPEPALRRARLLDYERTYPDTDRAKALEAQLDIINTAELLDWESLVQTIYDNRLPGEDKNSALKAYQAQWDGSLLGGRGEELTELQARLEQTEPADSPDRSLKPGESPISEKIPADILAGAPPVMVTAPPPPPPPPPAPVKVEQKDVIVQPRVRRNSSPNYPRTAQRKNIGAIVVVSMDIDEKGKVDAVETVEVKAERYQKEFRRAAERAAKRMRFHPKTINGKAVPAKSVRKRYIFRAN
jgi:TonB family protein